MRFVDERAENIGFDESLIARFALDDSSWGDDGPYLRVISHRDPGIAATYQPSAEGTAVTVQGRTGTLWVDPDTDPALAVDPSTWLGLTLRWRY